MAKPLDNHTDEELERGLADGDFRDKKAAVAEEILRRRHELKTDAMRRNYKWLGGAMAALSLAFVSLRRVWRK